ncbi:unnamed protein product [Prunus armeniaca]
MICDMPLVCSSLRQAEGYLQGEEGRAKSEPLSTSVVPTEGLVVVAWKTTTRPRRYVQHKAFEVPSAGGIKGTSQLADMGMTEISRMVSDVFLLHFYWGQSLLLQPSFLYW